MARITEAASETMETVRFCFMTTEEVRKHSVVKITNPNLLDTVDRPMPGGLYDPAMGPLDEQSLCKSCGLRPFHCPGHCGHIELVSPAYNPLLFNTLHGLLQKTCFYCFHFRSSRKEVERCIAQLKLIAKGDVVGANNIVVDSEQNFVDPEDSEGSHISSRTADLSAQEYYEKNDLRPWDSYQFTEAMSVLNRFLKQKPSKCSNCEAKNPKINKPTFGWFHLAGMSNAQTRANIIRGCTLNEPQSGGTEEKSLSEVVNANESSFDNFETAETISSTATSNSIQPSGRKNIGRDVSVQQELEKQKNFFSGPLLPTEVRNIMRALWENEAPLCSFICDIQQDQLKSSTNVSGFSMFFLEAVLVPPIKFRPAAKGGDSVMEHPHTVLLGKVLQSNIALGNALVNSAERSRVVNRWMDLQQAINVLFDSKTATGQGQRDVSSGVCQLLEKKEGIFRQKMMGKRVNHACRSVISPDPYLAVNEIGIPLYFALRLTYPEKVTPWNVAKLREAVINGPEIHPGATSYVDKVSTIRLPLSTKMRIAVARKLPSSRGVVTDSGKNSEFEFEGKTVSRHLQDGDIVLVNRQPTLHKPSIMAFQARVMKQKGEKTIGMHYANCSSFNADFDGDEINVHFPQDEVSRAEAYDIVNANEQYIVPTKGDTVRGLIQDHIVSAVLLTMKNTFLTYDEFNQLLYGSGMSMGRPSLSSGGLRKLSIVESEGLMQPILPAVWKPKPLWTGKQVITALLHHLTRGSAPCTVKSQGKIPRNYFTRQNKEDIIGEHTFLVWKNELVSGVIDKAQFGKFGLVHTVQEFYGSNRAGILLSALSRLFTMFLQINGFTCGVDDLIILPHYDIQRKEELEGEDVGEEVHCDFVKFKRGEIGPVELQREIEKAICSDRESAIASLDMKMKNKLSNKGSQISKELLTEGLLKPFPKNCISLMTTSGAKGSTVNFQQISSYLGQQELEGKRVPRMVSGKTLPSFPSWDYTARAGGYITDRFLTGLRPQEYYFHCMAGREGLVDTAVKTSRSGYLQRCLIKNLESLKVCYDLTVRDADGSIIQFYYGEDGVDVHRTSFLKNFEALEANQEPICQKFQLEREFNAYIEQLPDALEEKTQNFVRTLTKEGKKRFKKLMKQKYLSSLAQSGEPVGVLAAQSVGEPSTQMTLNTFHLAGRGEMNVTLGIPRLQEILMTAADIIKTPIMTCPFLERRSRDYAKSLLAKVKKVTIADILESMEVHLLPHSVQNRQVCRIYKLVMKLKKHDFVSVEECEDTLRYVFLRELEDAIENHLVLLSKIRGIKNFMSTSGPKASGDINDDGSRSRDEDIDTADDADGDDDDDDGDDERAEDMGSDMRKRKQQASDEMDYDDDSGDEPNEEESPDEIEKGKADQEHDKAAASEDDGTSDIDEEDNVSQLQRHGETLEPTLENEKKKSTAKRRKKLKENFSKKDSDRAIFLDIKGLQFEVHFRFTNEPHMLLAQIAQKTAKKVYIRSSGTLDNCRMVEYDKNENTVIWNEGKANSGVRSVSDQEKGFAYWALKAAGVDFGAFWDMQDDIDVTRIYTNNIHAMLRTYGVEAARATILREVKHVFGIYGVEIDYRHLSLIADYMTHCGGYRPMSRHGGIAESLSPFLKMSFETASKFIVEAASHGMSDNLETPSSRICLGLPVKMGTGAFDLMQKLDV